MRGRYVVFEAMFFRAFGIPTTIQFSFWFTCLLLNFSLLQGPHKYLILVWTAVVFVSIMVHELGHAFAMLRYGLQPEITLYMLGGLTATTGMNRLTRPQRIFVSFAGPLAGFVLGGLILAVLQFVDLKLPPGVDPTNAQRALFFAIENLIWVNIGWGLINLIPVLPLDGGHILEDALGPKRIKATILISMLVSGGMVLFALSIGGYWIALIFGLSAARTFQRYQMVSGAQSHVKRHDPPPKSEVIPPEIEKQLRQARLALGDERFEEAGTLAELILGEKPPTRARLEALHILAWAHLHLGRPAEAERVLKAIARETEPDLALLGAILLDKDDTVAAREVFETARAAGDDRKEIFGPLIRILIEQDEVARAAAIAYDVNDALNDEDVHQIADLAYQHGAFTWAARLYEVGFERSDDPKLAYEAARAMSQQDDATASLAMLRRAVAAGFSDAARAWSDEALEKLRSDEAGELEDLLPRTEG